MIFISFLMPKTLKSVFVNSQKIHLAINKSVAGKHFFPCCF